MTIHELIARSHPAEFSLFLLSLVAVVLWVKLVQLKQHDVSDNRRKNLNGPVKFMLADNRRFGLWMFTISSVVLFLSMTALKYPPFLADYDWMSQSLHSIITLNFVSIALIVEAVYRFRRRSKMAKLVTEYERDMENIVNMDPLEGGSRSYDPPKRNTTPWQAPTQKSST